MDLINTVPENDTLTVELVFNGEAMINPDGTPMTIEVYLPHSKTYRGVKHAQTDKLIDAKKERLLSAEAEELGISFLANTTKSWNITMGGKKPKFTVAKAEEIYGVALWIPDLLAEKVEEARGFTKA